jgi:4-hydroxy-tetrahydrodipicolinate synthase
MSGEDALNLPIMSCGGDGVISVTANILPRKVHDLVALCSNGKYSEALRIHQELIDINRALFIETNPIPVKESLHLMKMIESELRLPLCFMEESNLKTLEKVLKKYKLV